MGLAALGSLVHIGIIEINGMVQTGLRPVMMIETIKEDV